MSINYKKQTIEQLVYIWKQTRFRLYERRVALLCAWEHGDHPFDGKDLRKFYGLRTNVAYLSTMRFLMKMKRDVELSKGWDKS